MKLSLSSSHFYDHVKELFKDRVTLSVYTDDMNKFISLSRKDREDDEIDIYINKMDSLKEDLEDPYIDEITPETRFDFTIGDVTVPSFGSENTLVYWENDIEGFSKMTDYFLELFRGPIAKNVHL